MSPEHGAAHAAVRQRCRVCGAALPTAADRKLGRCADCPSSIDEALFERLRAWRLERAQEQKVPAYVVFTDATLIAIAETRPDDEHALAAVPGVGRTKLDRYAIRRSGALPESRVNKCIAPYRLRGLVFLC